MSFEAGSQDLKFRILLDREDAERSMESFIKRVQELNRASNQIFPKIEAKGLDAFKQSQLETIQALREARLAQEKSIAEQEQLNATYLRGEIDAQKYKIEVSRLNQQRREEARQAREVKKALQENSQYKKLESELNRLRIASKNVLAEMINLERQGLKNTLAYNRLSKESSNLVSQTQRLDNQIKRIDVTVGQHYRKVGNYGDAISMVIPQLSMFAGRLGLVAAGVAALNQSFQSNLRMEPINQSLKIASGTAENFKNNLEFLREISHRLGLEFVSTSGAFKMWQGSAKFSNLTASQSRDIFESVANASAKMKLSNEQVQGTFLALSQMMSKGKVQAEELRGQLGERLPGAFALAAKSMGVTEQQLNKMLEKGEVVAQDFLPKFAKQLDISFGNDKVEKITGMQASVNRLKNEFDSLWQSERASSFFTVVYDGFARMFKEINLMVNSKSWAEFKSIAFGSIDEHTKFVRERDLTPGQRAVPIDFNKKPLQEQLKLIEETSAALNEVVDAYKKLPNAGYAHDRKYYSDKLAEMNRLVYGNQVPNNTNGTATETEAQRKAREKAEKEAQRVEEKARQAVERQRSLQSEIDSMADQATRKQLSRDEEEIASITDKYKKMREKVDEFYRDPKNKGQRVDMGALVSAERFEKSEATTRQGTRELTKQLSEQREIYSAYNAYVEQNGIEAAEKMFGKQAELAKDFLANLEKELLAITTLQKSASALAFTGIDVKLTQAQEERAKALQEMIDALNKEERAKQMAKYAQALQLAKTFSEKEFDIRKAHNEAIANLEKDATEEQRAALDESLKEQIASLIESVPEYKKAMDDIHKATDGMLGDAFRTGKATVMKMINGMKDATEQQKGALRKLFGEFFDRGIKDADLGNLDNIARAANEFGGLVESALSFSNELDGGLKSLSAMVGVSSQVARSLASIFTNKKLSETFENIGAALPIFGAALSLGSSLSSFFNQAREQRNVENQAEIQASQDRQLRLTEAMTKALQMQLEIINDLYGTERLDEYESKLKDLNNTYSAQAKALSGKYLMTGNNFTDSILERLNNGETQSQIYKSFSVASKEYMALPGIFKNLSRYARVPQLSKDIDKAKKEVIELQTRMAQNGQELDKNSQERLNNLLETINTYESAKNKLIEENTGNSFSSLLSDVAGLFLNEGEEAGKAWSEGFDKVMENYMMQKFSRDFLQEKMQVWYDMLDDLSEGGITSSERDQLASEWEKIKEQGQQRLDEMKDVLGLTGGDSSTGSLKSEGITRITEEQASELIGINRGLYDLTKMQLTALESIKGNSVDYIGIANSQLSELNAINMNTANTVARLDTAIGHLAKISDNTGPKSYRQYTG